MKSNPNRIWIVELDEKKLHDMINDVEDIHRFLAGQTELFNTLCYLPRDTRFKAQEELRKMHPLIVPELANNPGANHSWDGGECPDEARRKKIARGYALYRNLRHCLEHYFTSDSYSVYKGSTLTCDDGGMLAQCYPKDNDINLTTEILLKNGFEEWDDSVFGITDYVKVWGIYKVKVCHFKDDDSFRVHIINNGNEEIGFVDVKTVGQLEKFANIAIGSASLIKII